MRDINHPKLINSSLIIHNVETTGCHLHIDYVQVLQAEGYSVVD